MSRFNILKWAAYTLSILLLSVIQMQAAFFPRFMDVVPLFLVPAVICIAMIEGETAGGIFGVAAGLFWDCGTGRVFGFNALFLMMIGITVGLFVKFLFRNNALSAFLFTIIFTITHETITWFFFYYLVGSRNFIYAFLHIILPTAGLTVIFSIPLYFGAHALGQKLTSQDSDSPV